MSQSASTIIEDSQATFENESLLDGWRRVKLRDVIREAQGGFASGERDANGVIQLRMNNVTTGGQFDWSAFIRVPASPETVKMYQLESGDVLFNNTNSTELVGKSALFEGHNEPVVFSNHFTRLRTDESLLEPRFLASWLQHQWQRHVFADICNRWIGQSAVQRDKLLALEILLPPLSKQKRIAAILKEQIAAVERARTAAEAQLKAAKDLPAAYLRAVFNSAEVEGWQVVKVGDITSLIVDGPHVTPMYVPKGVPFVTVRNIVNRRVDLSQVSYITETDHAEFTRRGKAEKGDILYTKDGTLGIPCVVDIDEEFSFFVSVALIKLIRERADSRFVAYALESPLVLKQVELLGAGAGLKHMVLRSIRALEIPLPPMPEQRKIAAALRKQMLNAEQTTKILKDQLDSINKLPTALLRQAFTGKL